jgi:chemotaxis protein MotB
VLGWIFGNARLSHLQNNVCFVLTQDGTRIDLVDDADCSMFVLDTTGMIAGSVQGIQRPIMIREHKSCRMATRMQ